MEPWVVTTGLALVALLCWRWASKRKSAIPLPGPRPLPLLGNLHQMDPKHVFLTLQRWGQRYGRLYKVHFPDGEAVICDDYESVYEVLVKKGKDFAGRYTYFRNDLMCRRSGIYANMHNDMVLRKMKKLTYGFIKPFGEGMSRLEERIDCVATEMFDEMAKKNGEAFNPMEHLQNGALKTITFLMTGEILPDSDKIISLNRSVIDVGPFLFGPGGQGAIIDRFPWLGRLLGMKVYKGCMKVYATMDEIWGLLKERALQDPDHNTVTHLALENIKGGDFRQDKNQGSRILSENDAQMMTIVLVQAGAVTTSSTYYSFLNVLAQSPDLQERLRAEVDAIHEQRGRVTLADQEEMPLLRATVLEMGRYFPVLPLALPHRAEVDTEIKGFPIPKDTHVLVNLWSVHHDKDFWGDPENFRPERYLDDDGKVFLPDHPRRMRTLAFGAGPRVCIGEAMARARLFIWTAILLRRFRVQPGDPDNLTSCQASDMRFGVICRSEDYTVRMVQREGI